MTGSIVCEHCRKRPVHPSRVYGYRCEDCWAETFGTSAGHYARPSVMREVAAQLPKRPPGRPRKKRGSAS